MYFSRVLWKHITSIDSFIILLHSYTTVKCPLKLRSLLESLPNQALLMPNIRSSHPEKTKERMCTPVVRLIHPELTSPKNGKCFVFIATV